MERATKIMQLVIFVLLVSSTSLQHVSGARPVQAHGDGFPLVFGSLKQNIPSPNHSGCTSSPSSSGVCPPTPPSN
jgi:hypothetical protein